MCSEAFAESLLDLECSLEDECLKLFGDGLWQQFAQVNVHVHDILPVKQEETELFELGDE